MWTSAAPAVWNGDSYVVGWGEKTAAGTLQATLAHVAASGSVLAPNGVALDGIWSVPMLSPPRDRRMFATFNWGAVTEAFKVPRAYGLFVTDNEPAAGGESGMGPTGGEDGAGFGDGPTTSGVSVGLCWRGSTSAWREPTMTLLGAPR
jgi:hypothetical protein